MEDGWVDCGFASWFRSPAPCPPEINVIVVDKCGEGPGMGRVTSARNDFDAVTSTVLLHTARAAQAAHFDALWRHSESTLYRLYSTRCDVFGTLHRYSPLRFAPSRTDSHHHPPFHICIRRHTRLTVHQWPLDLETPPPPLLMTVPCR